jgi:acyl-CoA thioesterase-1
VLQRELEQRGYHYRVLNLGVSGETTQDALRRMDRVLATHPSIVVLEFGANDALRGLPAARAEDNLAQMIETFQKSGVQVVLGGMILPESFAPAYLPPFNAMYRGLQSRFGVRLIPFFLDGAAGNPELMQPDAMHPNARGARVVAGSVLRAVEPLLEK